MKFEYISSIRGKIDLAQMLYNGEVNGKPADGFLILMATYGNIATTLWEGEYDNTLKKRFIELLIQYSPAEYRFSDVSIFNLHAKRHDFLNKENRGVLDQPFFNRKHPVLGSSIDKMESYFSQRQPDINLSKLRESSYAALLYEYICRPLVNQYAISPNASLFPVHQKDSFVNYVPDAMGSTLKICFDFNTLILIAQNILNNTSLLGNLRLAQPAKWWIDGGDNEILAF